MKSKTPKFTSPVQLERGVACVNTDRDWSNGSYCLLKIIFTSGFDVLVGGLGCANIRRFEVTFAILESSTKGYQLH